MSLADWVSSASSIWRSVRVSPAWMATLDSSLWSSGSYSATSAAVTVMTRARPPGRQRMVPQDHHRRGHLGERRDRHRRLGSRLGGVPDRGHDDRALALRRPRQRGPAPGTTAAAAAGRGARPAASGALMPLHRHPRHRRRSPARRRRRRRSTASAVGAVRRGPVGVPAWSASRPCHGADEARRLGQAPPPVGRDGPSSVAVIGQAVTGPAGSAGVELFGGHQHGTGLGALRGTDHARGVP